MGRLSRQLVKMVKAGNRIELANSESDKCVKVVVTRKVSNAKFSESFHIAHEAMESSFDIVNTLELVESHINNQIYAYNKRGNNS